MKKYSFSKGLGKGIIAALLFLAPFLVTSFPDIMNITIGGALVMILNYLKVKFF